MDFMVDCLSSVSLGRRIGRRRPCFGRRSRGYGEQRTRSVPIGTTREVVARLLGELVAQGRVRTRRGAVETLDAARLREIAGP
ncbi:helix-turn-helix domain-containing protein [Endothiovibrio diazotrophicus]